MESDKIEIILEKYFEGETSIAEEKELKAYFSAPDVAQHLEQYRPLFGFFAAAKLETTRHKMPQKARNRNLAWLSVAASVVVLLGIGTFTYLNYSTEKAENLGTYDTPEEAFKETQKALSLLSNNVNVGVKSVHYIKEYDNAKSRIFN